MLYNMACMLIINVPRLEGRKIGMFHRSTDDEVKEHILEDFVKQDSVVRIIIATDAFGLGIDIPDIRVVIFFGAPRSLETLAQQFRRAGRDGEQAFCQILDFPLKNSCTKEMKIFTSLQSCRREYINKNFSLELSPSDYGFSTDDNIVRCCMCCDICTASTSCEHNSAYPFDGTSRENDYELCESTENFRLKECVVDAVEQLLEEGIQRDRQKFVDDILLCHDMMLTVEQMKEELDIPLDIAVFIADVIKDAMIP